MARNINDSKLHLGARLRKFRRAAGYSQADVAMILGIERSTYAYYEGGKTVPIIFDLSRLAMLYDTALETLVDISERDAAQVVLNDSGKPVRTVVRHKTRSSSGAPGELMADLSPEERQVVGFYRSSTPAERREILQHLFDSRRSKRERL